MEEGKGDDLKFMVGEEELERAFNSVEGEMGEKNYNKEPFTRKKTP